MATSQVNFDQAPDLWEGVEGEFTSPEAQSPLPVTTTALVPVPKRTLRDYIEGVDLILESLEQLDVENLPEERQLALSTDLISALAGTREKVDHVNQVLSMFEGMEAAAEAEITRLEARVKRLGRHRQRLTDYVIATMTASNLPKLEGNTSTLTCRNNPQSVQIEDATLIPPSYLRYPVAPPQIDKAAIGRDLKALRAVPGARLARTQKLVRS